MKSREKILVSAVIWQRLGWKWGGGGANCSPHDAEGFPGQRRGHIEPSIARRQKFLVGGWLPFLAPPWQIQKGPRQPGQAGDLLMHEVSGPRGSTPSGLSMGFSIFAELVVEIMTPLKMW